MYIIFVLQEQHLSPNNWKNPVTVDVLHIQKRVTKLITVFRAKKNSRLRTVPTIVIAHAFCASPIETLGFPIGDEDNNIFARFKTIRTK